MLHLHICGFGLRLSASAPLFLFQFQLNFGFVISFLDFGVFVVGVSSFLVDGWGGALEG